MNQLPAHSDLGAYYEEAASWDADQSSALRREVRTAWTVAAATTICALTACAALMVLLPLKKIEPFLIRVDAATGIVDVVPEYRGAEQLPQAVTRYFLTHYVAVCERFSYTTAETDYEECSAFHDAQRNQIWYAKWRTSNPSSPLNVYKDGSIVRIQIQAVTFLTSAVGAVDLAQVRYLKIHQAPGGASDSVSHWIGTIRYAYASPSTNPKLRLWNPLGFKVAEFVSEPEVVREESAPGSIDGAVPRGPR
jgi:type IV secretion system protein VirB8